MSDIEGLDGGAPEVKPGKSAFHERVDDLTRRGMGLAGVKDFGGRSLGVQTHSEQAAKDPDFENRVDDAMRRSGMRLTRSEAEAAVRANNAYFDNVQQALESLGTEVQE